MAPRTKKSVTELVSGGCECTLTEYKRPDSTYHRAGKYPAYILADYSGTKEERWYKDGKLHNTDGAAIIEYSHAGKLKTKHYYEDGKLRSGELPGEVHYSRYTKGPQPFSKILWFNDKGEKVKEFSIAASGTSYSWGNSHQGSHLWNIRFFENGVTIKLLSMKKGFNGLKKPPAEDDPRWNQNLYRDGVRYCRKQADGNECWFDENGRAHREDGPAQISHALGVIRYKLRGVEVPIIAIESPEKLTFDYIKNIRNTESRRVVIEHMGIDRWLDMSKPKTIDLDTVPVTPGSDVAISRALTQDSLGDKYLSCACPSTGRVYHLSVPKGVTTCGEAHTKLAGFDENLIIAES